MYSPLANKLIAPVLITLFSSCSFINMNALEVSGWSPAGDIIQTYPVPEIRIEFSAPCNRLLVEKSFSLQRNGLRTEGVFKWNRDFTGFSFVPFTEFPDYASYEMVLTAGAEDIYGNSLKEEFRHLFSLQQSEARPSVLSCSPQMQETTESKRVPVIISFSEPVEPRSWLRSFSISPSVKGTHSWNTAETEYTFAPAEDLSMQTEYSIRLKEDLHGYGGKTLGIEFISRFYTGTDRTPPLLLNVSVCDTGTELLGAAEGEGISPVNSGLESFSRLQCSFSEPVKTDGLESFISIEPHVSFETDPMRPEYSDRLILKPSGNLEYDALYKLEIKTGFEDAQGNRMSGNYKYYLRIDGPESKPPDFHIRDGIAFLSSPDESGADSISVLTPDAPFPSGKYVPGIRRTAFFDFLIDFSAAPSSDNEIRCLEQNLLENLLIRADGGTAEISILGAYYSPPSGSASAGFIDDYPAAFMVKENQGVIRVYTGFTRETDRGIIRITIDKSFKDHRGLGLRQDVQVQYPNN